MFDTVAFAMYWEYCSARFVGSEQMTAESATPVRRTITLHTTCRTDLKIKVILFVRLLLIISINVYCLHCSVCFKNKYKDSNLITYECNNINSIKCCKKKYEFHKKINFFIFFSVDKK